MKIVIYKCDLCKQEISDLSMLKTVYWSSVLNKFTLVPTSKEADYDKQICTDCINMIKEAEL